MLVTKPKRISTSGEKKNVPEFKFIEKIKMV